jgi:hypothetical protein
MLKYAYEIIFSLIVNEDFSMGLFLRKKSDDGRFHSSVGCNMHYVGLSRESSFMVLLGFVSKKIEVSP